ncbi:MAG: hypothetical protein LBH28_04765 [Oscillospiraceae bacterium]|nr:hypothetical protein [Oscillospiraceae bacterium]
MAAYSPAPKTEYAANFIAGCEGQQWFIDEVERLLNANQMTLGAITGSPDLDIITSLVLKDRGTTGKIPKAIGELRELRELVLSGNSLSGELPSELFSLAKLLDIDLAYNAYTGAIPSGFGTMPALEVLVLRGNGYTGTIPDSILCNTAIKVLDVACNGLGGSVPADLNKMTGLVYLSISENPWSPGALPELPALTGLITLSARNCNLVGAMPNCIYTLAKLQVLDLSGNPLIGEASTDITEPDALQPLCAGAQLVGRGAPRGCAAYGAELNNDVIV